ncbi:hypothetical protein [Clavibacter capsici]|uniref:hypothetical protein n=1 Tax=Clavibacter capsici TaxID=1874630 RepID=UPI001428444C|nr:hypothetical protein [Clavibacter capsici]QIS38625.1 hypothetical protein GW572_04420 [Clavibacter capsici]
MILTRAVLLHQAHELADKILADPSATGREESAAVFINRLVGDLDSEVADDLTYTLRARELAAEVREQARRNLGRFDGPILLNLDPRIPGPMSA